MSPQADRLVAELDRLGAEAVTTFAGGEAIGILSRERFDAVVVDAVLDDVSALALVRWVQRLRPAPAVVVSGEIEWKGLPGVSVVAERRGAEEEIAGEVMRVLGRA